MYRKNRKRDRKRRENRDRCVDGKEKIWKRIKRREGKRKEIEKVIENVSSERPCCIYCVDLYLR